MRLYDISGHKYPSVTTILQIFYDKIYPVSDSSFDAYKQQRAEIGTLTHKMVELSLKGHKIEDELKEEYNGESYCFYKQVWPFIKSMPLLYCEAKVHSHKLKVAGTCDLVFKSINPGHCQVYDLKTSKRPKYGIALDGYKMQLSAYAHCLHETYGLTVDRAVVLMAYPNSSQEIDLTRSEIKDYLTMYAELRKQFYQKHKV